MSQVTTSPSRHLVDPQLLPFLDSMPVLELSAQSLTSVRTATAQPGPALFACQPVTTIRRMVPGPHGAPAAAPWPARSVPDPHNGMAGLDERLVGARPYFG